MVFLSYDFLSNSFPTSFDIYWSNLCKDLQKEISKLTKQVHQLKRDKEKLFQKNYQLFEQVSHLQKELQLFETKISFELQKEKDLEEKLQQASLEQEQEKKRNSYLSSEYELLHQKYLQLLHDVELENVRILQQENRALINEKLQLELQLEELYQQKAKDLNHFNEQETVKRILLRYLYHDGVSLSFMVQCFKTKGIKISEQEIYQIIQALSKEFHIVRKCTKQGILFSIKKPSVLMNQTISIENETNGCLEYLIYSDLHCFFPNVLSSLRAIDQINEYCTVHHITHAFHLGDFYSFPKSSVSSTMLYDFQKLEQKIIRQFPVSPQIFYGFLGGNHDKYLMRLGIDPVARFETFFPNFFSMGYSHCFLSFSNSKEMIAFHHPDIRLPLDSQSDNPWLYLKEYYQDSSIKRSKVFYDFLGHIHQYFPDSDFCLVPSLIKDRFQNGAIHVKVFFQKGRISKVLLVPLEFNRKLIATKEKIYKKVRTQ